MPKTKTVTKNQQKADEAATRIKLHKESIQKGTPLAMIKEKEIDINKKVMAAQQKADQSIAKAREKAEKTRQEALDNGPKEAQQYLKNEIKKAEKEAKVIEETASSETEKVKKQGLANYDKAVNEVMRIILP